MFDKIFGLLASQQRREILHALASHPPPSDGIEIVESGPDPVLRVTTEDFHLYHTHLPKLEDAGLIYWDRDAHVVEKGPQFNEVEPMLDLFKDHADEFPGNWP